MALPASGVAGGAALMSMGGIVAIPLGFILLAGSFIACMLILREEILKSSNAANEQLKAHEVVLSEHNEIIERHIIAISDHRDLIKEQREIVVRQAEITKAMASEVKEIKDVDRHMWETASLQETIADSAHAAVKELWIIVDALSNIPGLSALLPKKKAVVQMCEKPPAMSEHTIVFEDAVDGISPPVNIHAFVEESLRSRDTEDIAPDVVRKSYKLLGPKHFAPWPSLVAESK
jgi:hypothetical protein